MGVCEHLSCENTVNTSKTHAKPQLFYCKQIYECECDIALYISWSRQPLLILVTMILMKSFFITLVMLVYKAMGEGIIHTLGLKFSLHYKIEA